jgi:L-alanine-DL-glutamate epimerase-like enolase superfamily enzyme
MNITNVEVTVHKSKRQLAPGKAPRRDALQTLPGAGRVEVVVQVEDGTQGRGTASLGRVPGALRAIATAIEEIFWPLLVGQPIAFIRRHHEEMLRETEYHGSFGLAMFGIAALDTALWDCLGKLHGLPCWEMWGAVRETIPAYAMVGWLNYDDDQVKAICSQAVEQGFSAVKIKVGYPTLEQDMARVELVQRAIGPDIRLMVDANQSLTTKEAIRRGRAFEELGCYWWEEPIPAHDIEGYAALVRALDISIATGENLYTRHDFARFLQRHAVDILQPDLRRAGGPTSLLQVGTMADAFRIPYASHGGGPIQLNIMACLPNTLYLETGLIKADSPLELVDGCVAIPRGAGFSWNEAPY